MSNYHFGDDYDLNYYPIEASDGIGGVDWDKVERVEIEFDIYVKERTCKPLGTIRYDYEGGYAGFEYETELSCGHKWRDSYGDYPNYCPYCGARVVSE